MAISIDSERAPGSVESTLARASPYSTAVCTLADVGANRRPKKSRKDADYYDRRKLDILWRVFNEGHDVSDRPRLYQSQPPHVDQS